MNRTGFCSLAVVFAALSALVAVAAEPASTGLSNPFYAMDTAFQRPGLSPEQQLDLVKELGYAGVCWTEPPAQQPAEQALDKLKSDLAAIEQRGLKMVTIYFAARVTREGELTYSSRLPAVMDILKGHGTIIWLHIGGKGPAFDSLTAETPLVQKLRAWLNRPKPTGCAWPSIRTLASGPSTSSTP